MITPPMAVEPRSLQPVYVRRQSVLYRRRLLSYLILEFCILLLYMYVPIIFGISI